MRIETTPSDWHRAVSINDLDVSVFIRHRAAADYILGRVCLSLWTRDISKTDFCIPETLITYYPGIDELVVGHWCKSHSTGLSAS